MILIQCHVARVPYVQFYQVKSDVSGLVSQVHTCASRLYLRPSIA